MICEHFQANSILWQASKKYSQYPIQMPLLSLISQPAGKISKRILGTHSTAAGAQASQAIANARASRDENNIRQLLQ